MSETPAPVPQVPVLEVSGLVKHFPITRGVVRRKLVGLVRAVEDVSFEIARGETLALVGESGCGKSTTGRLVLRLMDPTAGSVRFKGEEIAGLDKQTLRRLRRHMQIIFQDPYASLNGRRTVRQTLEEPLKVHGVRNRGERHERANAILAEVGLPPQAMDRFPHEFSGGQRQRIGIARALVLNPELVVADEPVSALDVSVQAQILRLLDDLRQKRNLSFLFVSHDLGVVRHFCTQTCVMYLGHLIEVGPTEEILDRPAHPYAVLLRESSPIPDPTVRVAAARMEGEVPSPADPPSGCPFHTRCPRVMPACKTQRPILKPLDGHRQVACHLY
jgi:oligopeptide/dipeptide ABC transporter ATP-binding protein